MKQSMKTLVDIVVVSTACSTAVNRNIYKEFKKLGLTVLLVVPKELTLSSGLIKKADIQEIDDPDIEFMTITDGNSRISRFIGITKFLNLHRPKLVILDAEPISITALQIGLWAKIFKSKLFCISCENMSLSVLDSYRRKGINGVFITIFKRMMLIVSKKLVHGVFTINNEGTQIFNNESFSNVRKIPLGFDPKYFHINLISRKAVRSKLGLNSFVIGFFGRITYEKGIHILVDALHLLKNYKWTLMIDEFNIYKNQFQENIHNQIIQSGLIDKVVFVNPRHDEMGSFINSVDVVVMPSISTSFWIEQYGRVAAEAMACGKLVIASNSGALPMLLNNRGILFEEGDIKNLAAILKGLIVNTQSHKYNAKEISNYAHAELSINKQMKEMLSLFKETDSL
jgi:glycosyltransferase involved in cell wall biosynthesis